MLRHSRQCILYCASYIISEILCHLFYISVQIKRRNNCICNGEKSLLFYFPLPLAEGKEAIMLQQKKDLCGCTQTGYTVGFVSQNVGVWVIMKMMEMDLMLSFVNSWLISYSIITVWFNHLQTNPLLPPKIKQKNPWDKCVKDEVFSREGWGGCGFYFVLWVGLLGVFGWGIFFVYFFCWLGFIFFKVLFLFCSCFVVWFFGLLLSLTINWRLIFAKPMEFLLVKKWLHFPSILCCINSKSPMCL